MMIGLLQIALLASCHLSFLLTAISKLLLAKPSDVFVQSWAATRTCFGQVQIFGQDVLDYYGLKGYSSWEFVAYEILFFIGFFALCWFALAFKKHQKR